MTMSLTLTVRFHRCNCFSGNDGVHATRSLDQQALDQCAIQRWQCLQIGNAHMLVDLMNAGVDRADFDALRAQWRDEARVGGAAAGALFRWRTGKRAQHLTRDATQAPFRV